MADPNDKKKRVSLPVVGQSKRSGNLDDVDLGETPTARSPGSWVILGVLSVFAVLIPLAMLAMAALRGYYAKTSTVSPGPVIVFAIAVVAIASTAGGYVVGRFGHRCEPRHGAFSGGIAGVVMWALSRTPMGFAILAVTIPLGWLGARIGRRARKPGDTIGA